MGPCKTFGDLRETSGDLWETFGTPKGDLGRPLETFGRPLGDLWETLGRTLGVLWTPLETFGDLGETAGVHVAQGLQKGSNKSSFYTIFTSKNNIKRRGRFKPKAPGTWAKSPFGE